jgi:peptide/nickel transport system permease protein
MFCIILVNFVIINMAPGDPISVSEVSPDGNPTRRDDRAQAFGSDERYLLFREFYGLTLPILFNTYEFLSENTVREQLHALQFDKNTMPVKDYDELRIKMGDQARFVMPILIKIIQESNAPDSLQVIASRFFVRGGTRQGIVGPHLTDEEKKNNRKISLDNQLLRTLEITSQNTAQERSAKAEALTKWYEENKILYGFTPTTTEKISTFFTQTRFYRYMSRVLTLDFGTLRSDNNKTVISEVVKRFKYSLTLAIIPMFATFFLSLLFGFWMALRHNSFSDHFLNVCFLILYAAPVFVVAPFLIENVAMNRNFPFTNVPIPISGFTSPDSIYNTLTTPEKLVDILKHIAIPLIAVMYGSLAAQARLTRSAVLEVMKQDYVRSAVAKGLSRGTILTQYIGRNASITLVTSLASSLGVVLGGTLIVETLFQIDGFGKFFYDAVLNRDYNVIMFSTLAGSFLALAGYLIADLAYMFLDPRVTLD